MIANIAGSFADGLVIGFIYVFIALGLTMIFTIFNTINFAHGNFYMLGGYLLWYFFTKLCLGYFISIFLVILCLSLIGFIIEKLCFRPVRGHQMAGMLVSIAVSLPIPVIVILTFGAKEKGIHSYFSGMLKLGHTAFPVEKLMIVFICLISVCLLFGFLKKTKIGKSIRAVSQDSETARLMGISVDRVSSLSFVISTSLAGVAGSLIAPVFMLTPYMGDSIILKCFIIIVIGGLGSILGAVLAGLLIGIVESVGTLLMGSELATLILFALLILVLMVRPAGLLGYEEE